MGQHIIIARQNIIDPSTGTRHSDEGLLALNGIWKIPVTTPSKNETWQSIMENVIANFELAHPDLHDIEYEIVKL